MKDVRYAEPFAGSAAIGLELLMGEYASVIYINDLCRPVYAFWHMVLNETDNLCKRIDRVRISMAEWKRQHAVWENRESDDLDDVGFSAFFLNRTNRSGIIGGGVIGGQKQNGNWKIDARFNKHELIRRIRKIARFKNRIKLSQLDALDFINRGGVGANAFWFVDPPYIERGGRLYLDNYTVENHVKLAKRVVRLRQPWVVTYDYAAVDHELYSSCRRVVYGLHYTVNRRYEGLEAMFVSDALELPPLSRLLGPRMRLMRSKTILQTT